MNPSDNQANTGSPVLPTRKSLPHQPPPSVSAYAPYDPYFITICVNRTHYQSQGVDVGVHGPLTGCVAEGVLAAFSHYREIGRFWPQQVVVMPDHIHLIARFSGDMSKCISAFKHFIAGRYGVEWQRDFFDHRLRSQEEANEKWAYVELNPERKGLCAASVDWPYRKVWG